MIRNAKRHPIKRKFWKYCVRVYFLRCFSAKLSRLVLLLFVRLFSTFSFIVLYTRKGIKFLHTFLLFLPFFFYCIQFVCRRFALRKYFESLKLFFLYYFYSLLSFKLSTCHRGKKSFLLNFKQDFFFAVGAPSRNHFITRYL